MNSSSSSFISSYGKHMLHVPEKRHCLVAGNRGIAIQKVCQPVAGFQMLDQYADWHPGSRKHRSAAKHVPLAAYRLVLHETLPRW